MNCEEIIILLPELLGGGLERETEAEVLSHLAVCSSCREELAFWTKVQSSELLQSPEISPEINRQVKAAIKRETSSPVLSSAYALHETAELTRKVLRLTFACVKTSLAIEGT